MTFSLERRGAPLVFRQARLVARDWLSPGYVRVRLEGDELRGFDSLGCDDHIRVFFPEPGTELDDAPVDRSATSREYTPVAWDAAEGALAIDFVVHGDEGVAGPWAARAPIGSRVAIGGPRGSLVIEGQPDGWLLAGDETALPAIRRYVELMEPTATGMVVVEVPTAEHEQQIAVPAGVEVHWAHRGDAPDAAATALTTVLDALTAADRPAGSILAFVAAEQSIVRPARALLHDRWGLDPATTIAKGYWKRGEDEYHAPH